MLYSRITIVLDLDETSALKALARKERREPRAQAELIIRDELERRGLLPVAESNQDLAGVAHDRTDQR